MATVSKTIAATVMTAAALAVACVYAVAQRPAPQSPADIAALCREASNGCQVCRIEADGRTACSLPGIACQPGGWRCIKPHAGPLDSPPQSRPEAR